MVATEPTTDFMCGWLQGFFDGEGGAYWYDNPPEKQALRRGKHHSHKVSACNTDGALIQTATRFLTALGIGYRLELTKRANPRSTKPCWRIEIQQGPAIIRFAELVGFVSPAKAENLARIVQHVSTSPTYLHRRVNVEEMLLAYEAGYSYTEIAHMVGYKSGQSVGRILQRLPFHKSRTPKESIALQNKRHKAN